MSFFSPDPLGPEAERNRFKITSNYIPLNKSSKDLLVAQVNIPSHLLVEGAILNHIHTVVQLLHQQSGLVLQRDRPLVSVEATFIIRSKSDPQLFRVFVGSVQRKHQQYNQIAPPQLVRSAQDLKALTQEYIQPEVLRTRLDSSVYFPDSDWVFESVVSVVLNVNARVRLPQAMRKHLKEFYPL